MALRTRADYFGVHTGVEARELHRTSRLVADMLGMKVPPNKAVVGANAFSHSSGIHVDGFLKERETYEIMRPEDVGMTESRVVLTARTGPPRAARPPARSWATRSPRGAEPGLPALPDGGGQEAGGLRRGPDGHPARRDSPAAGDLPARISAHLQRHLGHSHRHRAVAREGRHHAKAPPSATVRWMPSAGRSPRSPTRRPSCSATRFAASPAAPKPWARSPCNSRRRAARSSGRGASTDVIEASAKAYIDGLNKLATAYPPAAAAAS